jgi:hypothetical protein
MKGNKLDQNKYKNPFKNFIFSEKNSEYLESDIFLNLFKFYEPKFKVNNQEIEKIKEIAVYFYNYVLFIDDIVDSDIYNNKNLDIYIKKSTFSIMIGTLELFELIRNEDEIWEKLYLYINSYITTICYEKNIENRKFDIDEFEKLAINKHSLVFFYLDLFTKDLEEDEKQKMRNVLEKLLVVVQSIDDIEDIDTDIQNNIITLPIIELKEFFNQSNMDEIISMQYLCASGIATKLYNRVLEKLKILSVLSEQYEYLTLNKYCLFLMDKVTKKVDKINLLIHEASN